MIGNGFDLHFGLNTKPEYFEEYLATIRWCQAPLIVNSSSGMNMERVYHQVITKNGIREYWKTLIHLTSLL